MLIIAAVVVVLKPAPAPQAASAPAEAAVGWAEVKAIIDQRCVSCHGPQVQLKNLRFDQPESVKLNAQNIYQQVVVLQQMPMSNATGITPEERATVGRWFKSGAPTQ